MFRPYNSDPPAMARSLFSVLALLMGTAFLLAANGLHGLLLIIRGGLEGFSTTELGLLGTGWATGFVLSCLVAPRLIRNVGHVRAFGAFCALSAVSALGTGLWIAPFAWVILRGLTGFCICGCFMIIESWLNERASNETRGTIFSLYMVITFTAIVAGQMMVAIGAPGGSDLFMVAGMMFCLALLPTAVSTAASPRPITAVRLDLRGLFRNSPVAFVSVFLIGIANGAFGTLGPVFFFKSGLDPTGIALIMSITILAGAVSQIPMGRLSDRTDRRYVIAGTGFLGAAASLLMVFAAPGEFWTLSAVAALYGAMAYCLYPLTVAHANDFAGQKNFIEVSGGLLLLYGFGTIAGPILAATAMAVSNRFGLFAVTALMHAAIGIYALLRSRSRAPMPIEAKEPFKTTPSNRASTQQSFILDPRADNDNG